jgi:hypothetical protein
VPNPGKKVPKQHGFPEITCHHVFQKSLGFLPLLFRLPGMVEVNIEVKKGLFAVGDIIDFAFVIYGLVESPGLQGVEDVLDVGATEKGAGTCLATIQDGMGDFGLSRRVGRVIEGILVFGKKFGKFLPSFLKK